MISRTSGSSSTTRIFGLDSCEHADSKSTSVLVFSSSIIKDGDQARYIISNRRNRNTPHHSGRPRSEREIVPSSGSPPRSQGQIEAKNAIESTRRPAPRKMWRLDRITESAQPLRRPLLWPPSSRGPIPILPTRGSAPTASVHSIRWQSWSGDNLPAPPHRPVARGHP